VSAFFPFKLRSVPRTKGGERGEREKESSLLAKGEVVLENFVTVTIPSHHDGAQGKKGEEGGSCESESGKRRKRIVRLQERAVLPIGVPRQWDKRGEEVVSSSSHEKGGGEK